MTLVLAAVSVFAFAADSFVTSRPVNSSRFDTRVVADAPDLAGDQDVDAYGNEVTDAVAEYSIDGAGGLYELHSPQTELPRLGSPKS